MFCGNHSKGTHLETAAFKKSKKTKREIKIQQLWFILCASPDFKMVWTWKTALLSKWKHFGICECYVLLAKKQEGPFNLLSVLYSSSQAIICDGVGCWGLEHFTNFHHEQLCAGRKRKDLNADPYGEVTCKLKMQLEKGDTKTKMGK